MRQMWKAVPFRPFVIQMNDGRKFNVPHPDFLSISPKGTEVLVYDRNEASHFISPLLIASVTPQAPKPKKSR